MARYRVWYTMEGYVDIDADSEEEALSEFGYMSSNELETNLFPGPQVDDIKEQ